MAEKLGEQYQIVLVGTDDEIDKNLPHSIISIHRTQNQKELAEVYSAADVFVMPTREENYPTVNMEAIACGTPVATFDTGGSPEMLDDKTGIVVEANVLLNALMIPLWGASGAALASLLTQISTILLFPALIKDLQPNVKLMIDAIRLKGVF